MSTGLFLAQDPSAPGALTAPGVAYGALSPVLIILGVAVFGVLVEAFVPRPSRWATQVGLTLVGFLVAGAALAVYGLSGTRTDVATLAGAIAVDQPTLYLWAILLALGAGSVLLVADRSVEPGGAFVAEWTDTATRDSEKGAASGRGSRAATLTREQAGATSTHTEVFPLVLFSLAGMMVFVAANDLLSMFVALEVLSLPLYLLCGLARRRRLLSQESAVKYFLLGAFASGFFLYGLALLYGYAGTVSLPGIAAATGGTDRSDTLLFGGLALLLVGLLFKASIGPFHTWTPDVYQGAPTPITAFMATCTKVAAFGAILRVLTVAMGPVRWDWRPLMIGVAIASMVIGTVASLTQTDMKRMIAYSSVAQAGFILVGTIALTPAGLSGTLFYLLAYGCTTLAALGVISLIRDSRGEAGHLSQWSGLGRRSPLVAGVFTLCMLSLAGIPLTGGFIGKFSVFSAAYADGMIPLVVVGVVVSAIAAFFYLRVVVVMFFNEPAVDGPTVTVPGVFTTVAISVGALSTMLLGIVPGPVIEFATVSSFLS